MKIERTDSEIIIRLPSSINVDRLSEILENIRYNDIASHSNAEQDDIDDLAEKVNKSWWKANKSQFIS